MLIISIPAAIATITIGIIALVQHRPGKAKSISGIITGSFALVLINLVSIFFLSGAIETVRTAMNSKEPSAACHTAVNLPGGDALSRVEVKATTGTIGTLDDVVAKFNTTLKTSDPTSSGILDQEEFKTADGKTVYYLSFKDGNKLLFGVYIVNDPKSDQMLDGEAVVGYSVLGYTYNSALKGTVRSVVDSLETK